MLKLLFKRKRNLKLWSVISCRKLLSLVYYEILSVCIAYDFFTKEYVRLQLYQGQNFELKSEFIEVTGYVKHSLEYHLEKTRKPVSLSWYCCYVACRVRSAAPYNLNKKSPECATPESNGANFTVSSTADWLSPQVEETNYGQLMPD